MPSENNKCISNLQTIHGSKKENTSPKKKKKMFQLRKTINSYSLTIFVFISFERTISFFTGSYFSQEAQFILKNILPCMWRYLDTSVLLCPSCLFASLILLCKFVLILPETHSLSHEKKMVTKFVYFLETTMYECSIIWMNMILFINLVVNSALF